MATKPKTEKNTRYIENNSKNDILLPVMGTEHRMVKVQTVVDGCILETDEPEAYDKCVELVKLKPAFSRDQIADTRVFITESYYRQLKNISAFQMMLDDRTLSCHRIDED